MIKEGGRGGELSIIECPKGWANLLVVLVNRTVDVRRLEECGGARVRGQFLLVHGINDIPQQSDSGQAP